MAKLENQCNYYSIYYFFLHFTARKKRLLLFCCIWQLRNVANGSIFFEWKIRLNIQVMNKILYIQPLFNTYAYYINATQ